MWRKPYSELVISPSDLARHETRACGHQEEGSPSGPRWRPSRRGGARRATIARKPRRRVHCATHARNLGLLRRHAHRQLGLGQMTALNREWRHVLSWVSWSTMRLQLNIMYRITKSESWTMSVTKTTLLSFKVWLKPFIFGTPLFKRLF